ncbi:hypothetical protein CHARACLAT_017406 [Characodon lateralis]|uniref:Uncharacterized protein n=1 Tax=Characodon lateralis TaxID=208331 RepID=A0ABU7D7P3_9TELE|nr:hypothetical protein [Characodon lateralis]
MVVEVNNPQPSQLLNMIVCDPKNKACMDPMCQKCCFDEVKFAETDCPEVSTIHTAVLCAAHGTKSYATLSESLRHEWTVWAHLEPILKELRAKCPEKVVLHVISDGPVAKYRNKSNFYLLSTVPSLTGFKHITWNYCRRSHGKGAPDGLGWAIKRCRAPYLPRR